MIIRARPRLLCGVDFSLFTGGGVFTPSVAQNEFFLGSGRSALKFFLTVYTEIKGKPLRVLMQAFNCEVVRDAVVESGSQVVLCDIGLKDFSVEFNTLLSHKNKKKHLQENQASHRIS